LNDRKIKNRRSKNKLNKIRINRMVKEGLIDMKDRRTIIE